MQKKLTAMAVAGALGSMGSSAVWAQASSVQIYGTITTSLEYAQAKGADSSLAPPDGGSSWRNPAGVATGVGGAYSLTPANRDGRARVQSNGSNFGLRGREDLGSGVYAGFQAELGITLGSNSAQASNASGTVATWRNSGVWIGGKAWGEVGWGMWDTPITINMALAPAHAAYDNPSTQMQAGLLGTISAGAPGAKVSGYTVDAQCNPNFVVVAATGTVTLPTLTFGNSAATCFNWGTSFNRRVSNAFWYQSPTWAGFRLRLQYGAPGNQTTASSGAGASGTGGKLSPALYGVGATYTLGGLYAGFGYEYHKDYLATASRTFGGLVVGGIGTTLTTIPSGATGVQSSGDWAWNANLRYTFAFGLTLGGYYEQLKYRLDYNNDFLNPTALKRLDRDAWRLDVAYQIGPHTFAVQYGQAGDVTCNNVITICNGDGTGTTVWILGYGYNLSKRTSLYAYATLVNNDQNAASNGIFFTGITPSPGADPRYYGFGLRHTF